MPQMSQVLREHAIGMLTAGMSTRAVARDLNVHFSTISHLQRHFREFWSTYNRHHNRRPHITTPAQNLHIQHLHLQVHLRPSSTPPPPNTVKLHILEWPFIVASLRHTCAIIVLSNQQLDMPHVRWMDYLCKGEVFTNTDLDRFVNNFWEK